MKYVLSRLTVEYGPCSSNTGGSSHPHQGVCTLAEGEYITKVEANVVLFNPYNVFGGITFITNIKTCGHYGVDRNTGTLTTFEGNKLLYFTGRKGTWFDRLELHFDYC